MLFLRGWNAFRDLRAWNRETHRAIPHDFHSHESRIEFNSISLRTPQIYGQVDLVPRFSRNHTLTIWRMHYRCADENASHEYKSRLRLATKPSGASVPSIFIHFQFGAKKNRATLFEYEESYVMLYFYGKHTVAFRSDKICTLDDRKDNIKR